MDSQLPENSQKQLLHAEENRLNSKGNTTARPHLIRALLSLLVVAVFFLSCKGDDQPEEIEPKTLSGDVLLQSQSDVDDFAQERITHITGNLIIGNAFRQGQIELSDLTSIKALSTLTEVEGNLVIFGNGELTELEGLERLEKVGGEMVISFNTKLTDIDALANLKSIDGKLWVQHMGNITNLEVFDGLTGIQDLDVSGMLQLSSLFDMSNISLLGELTLATNARLTSLDGLANTAVTKAVIVGNDALENLRGLESTVHLESLELRYNQSLRTVEGLQNLKSIDRQITLQHNESLEGLQQMGTLETGPFALSVEDNPELTSLGNFKMRNLQSEEEHWAGIYNNPKLTSLSPLSDLTSLNNLQISNNDKITDLKDLSNLTQVGHFNIIHNDLLTDLQGLERLTATEILYVGGNINLESLNGLNGLTTVSKIFQVSGNEKLADLCALQKLVDGNGIMSDFELYTNAFNPTLEDLKSGKCSN